MPPKRETIHVDADVRVTTTRRTTAGQAATPRRPAAPKPPIQCINNCYCGPAGTSQQASTMPVAAALEQELIAVEARIQRFSPMRQFPASVSFETLSDHDKETLLYAHLPEYVLAGVEMMTELRDEVPNLAARLTRIKNTLFGGWYNKHPRADRVIMKMYEHWISRP